MPNLKKRKHCIKGREPGCAQEDKKADAEMIRKICFLSQEVTDLNFRKKHIRETFSAGKDNE